MYFLQKSLIVMAKTYGWSRDQYLLLMVVITY